MTPSDPTAHPAPAARAGLIEAAPGVFVDPLRRREVSAPARRLQLNATGYAAIGLDPGQWQTLRRLWEAGFIVLAPLAPRLILLDLDSWEAHLQRVSEDPWYWDHDGAHLKKYRGTYR